MKLQQVVDALMSRIYKIDDYYGEYTCDIINQFDPEVNRLKKLCLPSEIKSVSDLEEIKASIKEQMKELIEIERSLMRKDYTLVSDEKGIYWLRNDCKEAIVESDDSYEELIASKILPEGAIIKAYFTGNK